MNIRLLAPPSFMAAALTFLVMVLAVLAPTPSTSSASDSAAAMPGGTVILAKPNVRPIFRLAGAYVHVENCQRALIGGNGDNDIANWINAHSPYGITSWAFSTVLRYSNTDVAIAVNMYRNGKFLLGAQGECWGSDANISDNIAGP